MQRKYYDLPPLKRFRLMQRQPEQKNPENSVTNLCLPAKKRELCCDSPPIPVARTSFCLPAKKRIWAIQPPFDLNLEYEPSDTDKQEIPPEEPESELKSNGVNEEEENDEDGIVCAVCDSTDGDPTDPIVLCDGCDLMVHTACYGHPFTDNGIPEGDWFCAECLESGKESPISCCLCPVRGGALKPTTFDGKWAHLVCAIYVPEVFFVDPERREGIDCSMVLKRRWQKKCYVCKSKYGCVVDCSEPNCKLTFHVSCGFKAQLFFEYRQGKNNGDVVAAFCRDHTDLWNKQEQTGKFKIVARDENKK